MMLPGLMAEGGAAIKQFCFAKATLLNDLFFFMRKSHAQLHFIKRPLEQKALLDRLVRQRYAHRFLLPFPFGGRPEMF